MFIIIGIDVIILAVYGLMLVGTAHLAITIMDANPMVDARVAAFIMQLLMIVGYVIMAGILDMLVAH